MSGERVWEDAGTHFRCSLGPDEWLTVRSAGRNLWEWRWFGPGRSLDADYGPFNLNDEGQCIRLEEAQRVALKAAMARRA
jgi:hypothetical protein